jgi:hypothetical protein
MPWLKRYMFANLDKALVIQRVYGNLLSGSFSVCKRKRPYTYEADAKQNR